VRKELGKNVKRDVAIPTWFFFFVNSNQVLRGCLNSKTRANVEQKANSVHVWMVSVKRDGAIVPHGFWL
jgi:hypothetical protein